MATTFVEKAPALAHRPAIADVVTVDGDGRPQVTPVWIDLGGDDPAVTTAPRRVQQSDLATVACAAPQFV